MMPMPPPQSQPCRSHAWAYVASAALLAVFVLLALGVRPEAASAAASPLSWSTPVPVDTADFADPSDLSCPTSSLCVAVDYAGNVLTSTNPTGGASAWTVAAVDPVNRDLMALSCPTTTFCAAIDFAGNVLTSTNPTGGAAAWHPAPIDGSESLIAISCASASMCAAVDLAGKLLTSTDPTGEASTWQGVTVDTGGRPRAITCPSVALCVLVDDKGNVLTSTNPTGGAAAWSLPEEIAARTDERPEPLYDVSCPTTSFCAAVDGYEYTSSEVFSTGDVITTTNPTGGAGVWSAPTHIARGLLGLSCPSAGFCLTSDFSGSIYASNNPTGDASAWTASDIDSLTTLTGISCPSVVLCVAVDSQGNVLVGTPSSSVEEGPPHSFPVFTSQPTISGEATEGQTLTESHASWTEHPTSFTYQWGRCTITEVCELIPGATLQTYTLTAADVGDTVYVEEMASNAIGTGATDISAETAVVQAASSGGEEHGGPSKLPPVSCCDGPVNRPVSIISAAQIKALLASQLIPPGKVATIAALLKHGGLSLSFTALEAGTLVVGWYEVPSGAKLAKKTKAKPILVASGRLTFSGAGAGTVKLTLTAAGKRLLKHAKRVELEAKGAFTPKGGVAVSSIGRFQLKR